MKFNVSTTVSVLDQETGERKFIANWTDADYEMAFDIIRDNFSMGLGVPFEEVKGQGQHGIEHITETDGRYEATIEVPILDVMEEMGLDTFVGAMVPTDYVTPDNEVFEEDKLVIEGDVYGDYALIDELRSRIYEACRADVDETPHIVSKYEEGHEAWHVFAVEFPHVRLFEEFGSATRAEQAIKTGDVGIGVEFIDY